MRVRLKGLNSRTKRLANGDLVTYYYAWKGGPALKGVPGSPEFLASYHEAVSAKRSPSPGTLLSVLMGLQASDDFRSLEARTRSDYVRQIKRIEAEYSNFPLDPALGDSAIRKLERRTKTPD